MQQTSIMAQITEFPITEISNDPEKANYQNYQAWQQQIARRRRSTHSQFNFFQAKTCRRSVDHALYKEERDREFDQLKDIIESRLSQACECSKCDSAKQYKTRRSGSDASAESYASSRSSRDSLSTLSTISSSGSQSPPGVTVRGPTSPSSRNSLITSRPPTSRHHQRRKMGANT